MSNASKGEDEPLPRGLSDQVSKEDSLNFSPYIMALEYFLLHANPPLTVSIEGEWGAGKSSFMYQLAQRLEDDGHVTVQFNPWRHQSEDALWAAFILTFIDQISAGLTTCERVRARLNLLAIRSRAQWNRTLLRAGATVVLYAVAVLAVAGLGDVLGADRVQTVLGTFGVTAVSGVALAIWIKRNVVERTENELRAQLSNESYEDRVSFVERFHSDFGQLLDAYVETDQRIFVFIDDLDRCELSKVAELVESIHLMLADDPRLVFLIGMDREKVAGALAAKHDAMLQYLNTDDESDFGLDYGHRYLEKLVQIPFDVPEIATENITEFVDRITTAAPTADPSSPDDNQTGSGDDALPRDRIRTSRRPALADPSNPRSVPVSGWTADRLHTVTELVAPALDHNPRQLKRFVNLYTLTALIVAETERFRRDMLLSDQSTDSPRWRRGTNSAEPTLEQVGKFAVIPLRWPRLHIEVQKNTKLLTDLTLIALQRRYWKQYDDARTKTDNTNDSDSAPEGEQNTSGPATRDDVINAQVAALTTEVTDDDIPVLLDLLLAGLYSDERKTDQPAGTRTDQFLSLIDTFPDEFDEYDREEFFSNVGPAQIERVTEAESTYSLANDGVVRALIETSPHATSVGETRYRDMLTYRRAVEQHPEAVWIRVDFAELLSYQGKVEEAEEQYQIAIELDPDDAWIRRDYAEFLDRQYRYDEAIKQCQAAVALNPDDAWIRKTYAKALRRQNRFDDAEEQYQAAIKLDPDDARIRESYAWFLGMQGNYEEEKEQFRIAIDLEPNETSIRRDYARLLARMGDDEADEQCQTIIKLDPDDVEIRRDYAKFLRKQGRYDDAERQHQAIIETVSNDVRFRFEYAEFLSAQGRQDEAAEQYRLAIEFNPEDAEAHYNYAVLLHQQGRIKKAEERYQQALKLDPDHTGARNNYTILLGDQDRNEEVEEQYKQAIELNPNSPEIHRKYADFLTKQSSDVKAQEHYTKANELGADDEDRDDTGSE